MGACVGRCVVACRWRLSAGGACPCRWRERERGACVLVAQGRDCRCGGSRERGEHRCLCSQGCSVRPRRDERRAALGEPAQRRQSGLALAWCCVLFEQVGADWRRLCVWILRLDSASGFGSVRLYPAYCLSWGCASSPCHLLLSHLFHPQLIRVEVRSRDGSVTHIFRRLGFLCSIYQPSALSASSL